MTLAEAPSRTTVTVVSSSLPHREQRRLTELGLRHGARVEVLRRAPFGGPLALRVGAARLAVRAAQASRIHVAFEASDA